MHPWVPAGGTVWRVCGTFRNWDLAGRDVRVRVRRGAGLRVTGSLCFWPKLSLLSSPLRYKESRTPLAVASATCSLT